MWWTFLAAALGFAVFGRPLSQAARRSAEQWLGVRVEPSYRPVQPPVRMSTGFWWNGYEYHQSEREARRAAWLSSRRGDPQWGRDALWALIASVTVLPAAAAPLAVLSGGVYMASRPGLFGWGLAMIAIGIAAAPFAWRVLGLIGPRFLGPAPHSRAEQRVKELESVRAELTQSQAAEMERIERGLHDGAQARLVALGMSVQAAERLIDTEPDAAKAVLAEARASSVAALAELRLLVRGINPPVLAERGLVDAVRALALDAPVEVTVGSNVPARPERPVEAAVYFAVAELIANAAKHARASKVNVELDYGGQVLTVIVTDDGAGGAAVQEGSGLAGVIRRMAAFGGTVEIESPAGGPTLITVTVPCVLS
jgi:signal transduction histidine kinase